ncbi:hypothetical protein LCGC14_0527740, partial [marine sediment metagenome]
MKVPEAVIVDGKVTNGPQLRRYWQGVNDRKARIRQGLFFDLRQSYTEKPQNEPEERWVNKQWDVINQLRAMVLYLQEKVNKSTD